MLVEGVLDFGRTDVFAPGNDHILLSVHDVKTRAFIPNREIAGVEPAVSNGFGGLVRLFPVAREDDVRAHADLSHGLAILGDGLIVLVANFDFDAQPRNTRPGSAGPVGDLGFVVGLGDREQRRGFGEAVDLDEFPAQFGFEAFDEGGGRRGSCDGEAGAGFDAPGFFAGVVENGAKHGRGHACERDLLFLDEFEDPRGVDIAKNDMGSAQSGERVDAAPPVAVEEWKRPEFDIVVANSEVGNQVVGVQYEVSVREHHALGPGCRSRGVVDRDEVVFGEFRGWGGDWRGCLYPPIPVHPVFRRRRIACSRGNEMLDRGQLVADFVHHPGVLGVGKHDSNAGVIEDVGVIRSDQSVVQGNEDGPNLAGAEKALEEVVRIRTQDADPISGANAEFEEGIR